MNASPMVTYYCVNRIHKRCSIDSEEVIDHELLFTRVTGVNTCIINSKVSNSAIYYKETKSIEENALLHVAKFHRYGWFQSLKWHDVKTWVRFPHCWTFTWGIHRPISLPVCLSLFRSVSLSHTLSLSFSSSVDFRHIRHIDRTQSRTPCSIHVPSHQYNRDEADKV